MARIELKDYGKKPLCNHRADRGIYIHGFCLPLCTRCTGLLAGSIAGAVALRLTGRNGKGGIKPASGLGIGIGTAMLAPTAIDGTAEYFAGKESNNRRRLLTGLLAGAGCAVIEKNIVDLIRKS